jgi:hypothetical protein
MEGRGRSRWRPRGSKMEPCRRVCMTVSRRFASLDKRSAPDPHQAKSRIRIQLRIKVKRRCGFAKPAERLQQHELTKFTVQPGSDSAQLTVQEDFNYACFHCNTVPIPLNLQCSTAPTSQSLLNMVPNSTRGFETL